MRVLRIAKFGCCTNDRQRGDDQDGGVEKCRIMVAVASVVAKTSGNAF